MYIAVLGRQPELGLAELVALYPKTSKFSDTTALIKADTVSLSRLGGSLKIGRVIKQLTAANLDEVAGQIIAEYRDRWLARTNKLTLGVSIYDFSVSQKKVNTLAFKLKKAATNRQSSVRLIPSNEPALSTATSHHNKLGLSDNKLELIIVRGTNGSVIIAESTGSQNITAYAARDQKRPKRDAFVGMLPPKLAQIMINLAMGDATAGTVLDPFCGTGVILQEAALMGYQTYGSDLSDKMIDYSNANLNWLAEKHRSISPSRLEPGDAMTHKWQPPITAVVCETYLGQPFSAPPSAAKLHEVRSLCDHIVNQFLKNIHDQLKAGTMLCLAVPAWRDSDGRFTHLPISIESVPGFKKIKQSEPLLYHRPDQIVARELLVLTVE